MARQIAHRVKPGTEDFEILFSEFSVSVGSVRFAIHEYTITEGVRLGEAARKAVDKYKEGESADLIYLIAQNCDLDTLEIAGLNDATLTALVIAFERANKSWLIPEIPKPGRSTERWSSAIQALISHGHTLEAIRGYTLRQVYLFNDAIGRLSSRDRADRILDVNLGFAGGNDANDAIKTFKRAGE
jgi:hypothetical protein